MSLREIYSVKYEPFFDRTTKKYKNIITISQNPKGPLNSIVNMIHRERLSNKQVIESEDKCLYYIKSFRQREKFMALNELPLLYAYLKNNSYEISHVNLKWEDKIICFIEYFM